MSNEMMIHVVALFLAVALLFYCLFAGADFGAGILENFSGNRKREEQKEAITHAMAPVWEANHVWLILAIVILFNGFPRAFSALSISFHLPLTAMLIGIILRGTAFTFRHYDAVQDQSQKYYSAVFRLSSFVTPLFLGIVAGGMLLGRVNEPMSGGYYEGYVAPWLNFFSVSVGLFVAALFTFLAAVYLIGESRDGELKRIFIRLAKAANVSAVLAGALVFVAAQADGLPLFRLFMAHPLSVASMAGATVILFPLWISLQGSRVFLQRALAGLQITLILGGWLALQFPVILHRSGGDLTLYDSVAPAATLKYLVWALVLGILIILPALFYLLGIFKLGDGRKKSPAP